MDLIDKATIDALKEIFVTRQECDEKNDVIQEGQHNIDKRLSIIEALQDRQYKRTQAIFAAVIGNLATLILACIVFAIKMGAF